MEKRDALREAMLENEARSVRTTKLDVIDLPPQNGSPALGMMIAIVAKKDTKVLSHLKTLLGKGAAGAEEAHKILSKKPIQPVTNNQELVEMLIREPVYADIDYGGQALHKGLFVPSGMDAVSTVFPYNGGRLSSEGFTLVEHYRDDSKAGLEAFVLRSAPQLTPAERAALNDVPDDQLSHTIGMASWCETTWWVAATVALATAFPAATAVTATTLVISRNPVEAQWDEHLADDQVKRLGPAASARSLLAMRRNIIETNIPKLAKD